jgi:hypothetical protein
MKRKEKYGSETKQKEKYRSEKKNLGSERIDAKFSFKHAKRK